MQSLDFLERLDTNYIPTDDEVPAIQSIVDAERRAAKELDEEIAIIMQSLSLLTHRRDVHIDRANRHAVLVNRIRRVPDDILTTIFLAYLDVACDGYPQRHAPMTRANPSVILSHVCRRWRHLSLETGSLWTGLHIIFPVAPKAPLERQTSPNILPDAVSRRRGRISQLEEMADLWIARSAGYPLDVSFHSFLTGRISRCMKILCKAARRWRRADIVLPCMEHGTELSPRSATALAPLLKQRSEDFPLLQHLRLSVVGNASRSLYFWEELAVTPDNDMLAAPALRSVCIDVLSCPWNKLRTNWSVLTVLKFGGYSGSLDPMRFGGRELLSLLKACRQLIVGHFVLGSRERDVLVDVESICMPFLESLAVGGNLPAEPYIRALELPSLKTLQFNTLKVQVQYAELLSRASQWVQRFGSCLEALTIRLTGMTRDVCRTILTHTPNLVELDIKSSPGGDYDEGDIELLRLLTPMEGEDAAAEPYLCPKLKRLHCDTGLHKNLVTEKHVVEFIVGRRSPWAKEMGLMSMIENVEVVFGVMQTMDISSELQKRAVDTGNLRLETHYPSPLPLVLYDHGSNCVGIQYSVIDDFL